MWRLKQHVRSPSTQHTGAEVQGVQGTGGWVGGGSSEWVGGWVEDRVSGWEGGWRIE